MEDKYILQEGGGVMAQPGESEGGDQHEEVQPLPAWQGPRPGRQEEGGKVGRLVMPTCRHTYGGRENIDGVHSELAGQIHFS